MKSSEASVIVPEDFPRNPFPTALMGAQPKVAARFIEGRYVVGLTDEERQNRYLCCVDLVKQLVSYTQRKQMELSDISIDQLLSEIDTSIRHKDWELGNVEYDWIMQRLREHFQVDTSAQPSSPLTSKWVNFHSLEHISQALRLAIDKEPLECVAQRANLSVHDVEMVLSGPPDYTVRTLQALLNATGKQCVIMPAYLARLLAVSPEPRTDIPLAIDAVRHL